MPDIKVRVGQQNAVKVVSSISGSSISAISENVIGGIASVSQLNVSGVSTFIGVSSFKSDVYIDGDLYISDDINFDEFTATNGNITGILTVSQEFYYPLGNPYEVAYFDENNILVSTNPAFAAINYTNEILTRSDEGIPVWSGVIDGGSY